MIKASDIIKLLKDKNTDLSKEEIEKIIEEELQKDESEMDADLIELCLDALKEKETMPPKKKISFIRVASFVAAAAVLTFVITAVFPKLTNRNYNEKGVIESTTCITEKTTSPVAQATSVKSTEKETTTNEKLSSYNNLTETTPAPIHKEATTKIPSTEKSASTLSPEEYAESSLKKELKSNGFENIVLPKVLFEGCEILSRTFEENKSEIKIKSKEKIYDITIEKSSEQTEDENAIDVSGLKVSVSSENNLSEVRYRKNNLNYKIVFESGYEEAVRIAKTIC